MVILTEILTEISTMIRTGVGFSSGLTQLEGNGPERFDLERLVEGAKVS